MPCKAVMAAAHAALDNGHVRYTECAGLKALREAISEIRAKLDAEDAAEPPLGDRLREVVLRFESEHPTLAEATERGVGALSRLGI